jgi:plasmid stabilization system protein ParE
VVVLTPEAQRQLQDLIVHYESLDRPAATRNMMAAVEAAKERIISSPAAGLSAPRPYPELKKLGRIWMKEGRYWISYSPTHPPAITGVFFETVDIPSWV